MRARRVDMQDAWLDRVPGSVLSGMSGIVEAVLGANGRSEILGAALDRLRRVLGVEVAAALLVDAEGVEPFVAEAEGPLARPRLLARSAAGRFARHASPALVDDLAGDIVGAFATTPVRSMIAAPLAAGGVLLCARARARGFDPDDLALVNVLARRTGYALERSRLVDELMQSRAQLEQLTRHLVEVQEQERRGIARELHDEIGQLLTGLKLLLAPVAGAGEATRVVDELLARVRDLTMALRPPMLDDLGLVAALGAHVDRFSAQTRVRVRFSHRDVERRFPADVETAAFRIVQEALTNVARHAPGAEARVDLWCDGRQLRLRVEDNGGGFAGRPRGRSMGISGMRERARLAGGQLRVVSVRGRGVQIRAALPIGAAS